MDFRTWRTYNHIYFRNVWLFFAETSAWGARSSFMRKLLIIIMLISLYAYGRAGDRITEKTSGLNIRTVDEKNDAFPVQTVRWWYSGKRDRKHELECETGSCAEWVIEEEISGSIVIHADASIVKKNDKHCWDLYGGEIVVEMPAQEVTIVLTYTNTVCSSQKMIHQ